MVAISVLGRFNIFLFIVLILEIYHVFTRTAKGAVWPYYGRL